MNREEIVTELRACLALQNEITAKQLELATRYKAVVESRPDEGALCILIDGDLYALKRLDLVSGEETEMLEIARKLRGFYGGYRLLKAGKML
jgi:hypothetical protein